MDENYMGKVPGNIGQNIQVNSVLYSIQDTMKTFSFESPF